MLSDAISLNDGAVVRTYTLVSRIGMDSIRRETTAGVSSAANSSMSIKNTIDPKNLAKPNRHLVSFSFTEYDTAGKPCVSTVHAVITRAKGSSDAVVIQLSEMLGAFMADQVSVGKVLIGGN